MKKVILVIMALMLSLGLTACTGNNPIKGAIGNVTVDTQATAKPTDSSIDVVVKSPIDDMMDALREQVAIEHEHEVMAELVGAMSGRGFSVGANVYELYLFSNPDKLEQAKSGNITLSVPGLGDMNSLCAVNGQYVLIYTTFEDSVIEAFEGIM